MVLEEIIRDRNDKSSRKSLMIFLDILYGQRSLFGMKISLILQYRNNTLINSTFGFSSISELQSLLQVNKPKFWS